jgi:ligand-binding SRPBCC domain-containing protein
MAAEIFETRQWTPFPVELVFAFFANPSNLLHISPPVLKTRVESLQIVPPAARPQAADPVRRFKSVAAGAGSELTISFRPIAWLPFRVRWTARIVEFDWFSHFVDEQVKGPFAFFRHRHGIEAQKRSGAEGTLVSDQIEFILPGWWLGALLQRRVRRQLEVQFAVRQQRLEQVLEAAARQARAQR